MGACQGICSGIYCEERVGEICYCMVALNVSAFSRYRPLALFNLVFPKLYSTYWITGCIGYMVYISRIGPHLQLPAFNFSDFLIPRNIAKLKGANNERVYN